MKDHSLIGRKIVMCDVAPSDCGTRHNNCTCAYKWCLLNSLGVLIWMSCSLHNDCCIYRDHFSSIALLCCATKAHQSLNKAIHVSCGTDMTCKNPKGQIGTKNKEISEVPMRIAWYLQLLHMHELWTFIIIWSLTKNFENY